MTRVTLAIGRKEVISAVRNTLSVHLVQVVTVIRVTGQAIIRSLRADSAFRVTNRTRVITGLFVVPYSRTVRKARGFKEILARVALSASGVGRHTLLAVVGTGQAGTVYVRFIGSGRTVRVAFTVVSEVGTHRATSTLVISVTARTLLTISMAGITLPYIFHVISRRARVDTDVLFQAVLFDTSSALPIN
jgi:hypothetical protein